MLRRILCACALLSLWASCAEASGPGSILEGLGPVRQAPVYGFGGSSCRWGYHGNHYWPFKVTHTGYYGDHLDWGYRQGY